MQKEILDYLNTQRVGVLAVEMLDGSPHAATVHYAHSEQSVFYFETCADYRKTEALTGRETSRASFVVGSDESNMKTLQLDGEVRLLRPEEMENFVVGGGQAPLNFFYPIVYYSAGIGYYLAR